MYTMVKVSLRLVFWLCHPSVAMETIQDGRQTTITTTKILKANGIKSIVLTTADFASAICYNSNLQSLTLMLRRVVACTD